MVRSDRLTDIQTAVARRDAYVTYVSEVTDLREPVTASYHGSHYRTYRQKMRIEIVVVNDLAVQDIIDAIAHAVSADDTERSGSGSIFVTPLDQWVRIADGRSEPNFEAVGDASRRAS
jgi:nitrogen regulatory protein PII